MKPDTLSRLEALSTSDLVHVICLQMALRDAERTGHPFEVKTLGLALGRILGSPLPFHAFVRETPYKPKEPACRTN